jgi:hypothetical protein
MEARDRRASLALFGAAAVAWLAVWIVLVSFDPRSDPLVRYVGAALIGTAFGVTTAPLFWLFGFARQRRIAFRGDWLRAARRAGWVAGVVAIIVLLRLEGLFQPQIGLFLGALAIVAEVTLSARR